MPSSDTLVKPLAPSPRIKTRTFAADSAHAPPTSPLVSAEPDPRISQKPIVEIPAGERSFRRLLLADVALSVACPVAAVLALPEFPPVQAAWLGFVGGNFVLWTGLAVAGVYLIARDSVAGLKSPRCPDVPAGMKARSPQAAEKEATFN